MFIVDICRKIWQFSRQRTKEGLITLRKHGYENNSRSLLFVQSRIILSPPNMSTTGLHFCFGSASLLFLGPFFHSSPLAYWTPTNVGSSSFSFISYCHFIWRRKRQLTPVFLPGESQGPESLVGWHLWGCTESDTTEVTQQQQPFHRIFKARMLK